MRNTVYYHRKGSCIGTESWKFLIDPVSNSPESESDGGDDCKMIYDIPKTVFFYFCEETDCDDHSYESSMKAHPSVPYGEYFERMRPVVEWVVEDNIADSSPYKYSEKYEKEQTFEVFLWVPANHFFHEYEADDESKNIHESIPGWRESDKSHVDGKNRHKNWLIIIENYFFDL